ncbi:Cell death protease [Dinochytrium kinnereticum]|nr:Cell death protease [Dinochytrium kinnereticum]
MLNSGAIRPNAYSWHRLANVLYVEQPFGTGFSYDKGVGHWNLTHITDDFRLFLQNFYTVFPETRTYRVFLSGQGYAAVYISNLALDFIQKPLDDGGMVNLQGIGLGNPYIDRIEQGLVRNDALYLSRTTLFKSNITALHLSNALSERCHYATLQNFTAYPYGCDLFRFAEEFAARTWPMGRRVGAMGGEGGVGTGDEGCLSIYNLEMGCKDTMPKQMNLLKFLNSPQTRLALHIDPYTPRIKSWDVCSDKVRNDVMVVEKEEYMGPIKILPAILAKGIPVIMFNGERDFLHHYVGLERALDRMVWNGARGLLSSPKTTPLTPWLQNTTLLGHIASSRGLTYIRIARAGHLVGMDQPASLFAVAAALVEGKSGYTVDVKVDRGWAARNAGRLEKGRLRGALGDEEEGEGGVVGV